MVTYAAESGCAHPVCTVSCQCKHALVALPSSSVVATGTAVRNRKPLVVSPSVGAGTGRAQHGVLVLNLHLRTRCHAGGRAR